MFYGTAVPSPDKVIANGNESKSLHGINKLPSFTPALRGEKGY
jgi:hypothetical protein